MKLTVTLTKKSIDRLEDLLKTERGVGLIRQGWPAPYLDVYDAYKHFKNTTNSILHITAGHVMYNSALQEATIEELEYCLDREQRTVSKKKIQARVNRRRKKNA